MRLTKATGQLEIELFIETVLGMPNMRRNLCSVSQLCQDSADIEIIILEGYQRNGLYYFEDLENAESNLIEISDKLRLWHERLGHLSISQMKFVSNA